MWILPTTHPLYLVYAAECVESKEESKELLETSQLLLMWKSKPLLSKTFYRLWNRVYWIPRLFGRILKPSHQKHLEESYTESLADIHVSPLASQEKETGKKTLDTFGRIYSRLSAQQNLFSASSKMSADTSVWDLTKFTEAFQIWVTELRLESLQRRKLARHIRGNGSLSSLSEKTWGTPNASDCQGTTGGNQSKSLRTDVKNWATPTARDWRESGHEPKAMSRNSPALPCQVVNWATHQARDYRSPDKPGSGNFQRKIENGWTIDLNSQVNWPTPTVAEAGNIPNRANYGQIALSNHPSIVGKSQRPKEKKGDSTAFLLDPGSNSTNGKSQGQLNPAWVAQLMGTTLEMTFFGCMEMESLNKQQKLHG